MMPKRLVDLVNNGIGSFVSRIMIIAGLPAISAMAVFGFTQWSANLDSKLQAIIVNVRELKEITKETGGRVTILENQTGRMEERMKSYDARLTQLEKRAR